MKQFVAVLLWFAILGTYLPIHVDAFVNPNDHHRARALPHIDSVTTGSFFKKHFMGRFMSIKDNGDDESKPPIPPPTPPTSDDPTGEDDQDLKIPSEETMEAERPRVAVPVQNIPPTPVLPPMPKLQQTKQPAKPSRSLTPGEEKLALASGLGGVIVGALLGVIIDIENPNIDLTMSPILPPVFSAVFVSTIGYAFGGSEGGVGKLIRLFFGGPTVFVGNAITSIIDAAIDNAVTSAKNKVKETTDDIIAIPGKIADEIKATPGRVADAAVETATEIAEEIKATPGRVADAAVETATEIADEIKATPGRVAKQTKQAVEDVVDDTLDAVEDFVDDVKAIPQKAIIGVESALGVSKPSNPRPPLAPGTGSKRTPLPPKDLPGTISKSAEKKSLIPSITSLKIPEFPTTSADKSKPKAAPPKTKPTESNFPSEREPAKKDESKFGLPKFDISNGSKVAASKDKIEYRFPSETPPTRTEVAKFELPKFGGSPPKKAASSKPKVDSKAVDIALKRKKEAEAKAEAKRLREEEADKKKIEAVKRAEEVRFRKQQEAEEKAAKAAEAEAQRRRIQEEKEARRIEAIRKAEDIKRQKQLEAKEKAEKAAEVAAERRRKQEEKEALRIAAAENAKEIKRQKEIEVREKAARAAEEAAERRRTQEKMRQEKIEAQRQAAEKAKEIKRQKEIEAREKAARAAEEAAERRRMQEKMRQEKIEAQKQAAEKRRQEAEEKRRQSADKAQRKQVAAKSLGQAKSRTTISLGNLFGGNSSGEDNEVQSDNSNSNTNVPSPPGVPIMSNWEQNPDGSISGRIAGSPNFSDGTFITTSPVPPGASSNSVVKTSSGSRYFLDGQEKKGFSFSFGARNRSTNPKPEPLSEEDKPSVAFEMKRKAAVKAKRLAAEERKAEAEEKKAVAAALAEKRKAAAEAKRLAAEEKKVAAAALARERKAAAEAKRKAAAEERAAAAEEKRAKAAAAAEARKQADEQKRAKVAEAKRRAEEQKKGRAAQQQRAAVPSPSFFSGKNAGSKARTSPNTENPPKGVPIIKSWTKRSDGGVSGRIYGSPNFDDGDFIETSPISNGRVENGCIVSTKSRSRYFLSAETAGKKSNIMAAFQDLAGAKPGATITLTKERKEREAEAAIKAIEKAKPRSTFSLFGLGLSDLDKESPPKKDATKSFAKKNTRNKAPTAKVAPKGVPTLGRWKMNRDGSVTGLISGSPNFREGEQVTTSMIANGRIESGEIVTTGSGSRYFLE